MHTKVGLCEIYGYSVTAVQGVPKRDTGCPKGIAIGGRYGFAIVWVGNLNLDTFQGRCDKWT